MTVSESIRGDVSVNLKYSVYLMAALLAGCGFAGSAERPGPEFRSFLHSTAHF